MNRRRPQASRGGEDDEKEEGRGGGVSLYDPWSIFDPFGYDDAWINRMPISNPRTDVARSGILSANMDIKETSDAYVIAADTPGIKKEDITVEVSHGMLHLKGHRSKEVTEEREHYRRTEREFGSFSRSFRLPKNANADQISAKCEDGVLRVKVPKRENPQEEPKMVTIE